MTNPNTGPDNETIITSLHELELEGSEQESVTTQVVEFIATQKSNFETTVSNMQSQIDALSATQLPADVREMLNGSLKTLKTTFDASQRALTAAITPPTEPPPPPPVEPEPGTEGPLSGSRGRSRR